MNQKTDSFFEKYHLNICYINPNDFINAFKNEMSLGLNCISSLGMKRSFIKYKTINFTKREKIIVIDIGGTNIRGAIGNIKNGKIVFNNFKLLPMIGLKEVINKEKFYSYISNFIKSISKDVLDVSLCFSFECLMNENLDGKIINFGKNILSEGIIGTWVCQEIKNQLKDNRSIYLINDACATNLGGQSQINKKGVNYISYILGSGVNASYYENNQNKSIKEMINIEVCGFDKFNLNLFEKEIIKETGNVDVFEKITSGVYFGKLLNKVLNKANKDHLINLKKNINEDTIFYSKLIKQKTFDSNYFMDIDSFITSKKIIKKLIMRNAYLNSLVLTSIIQKCNHYDEHIISIEGSTFKKLPSFEYYFKKFTLFLNKDININFIKGSNYNLKGAHCLYCDRN